MVISTHVGISRSNFVETVVCVSDELGAGPREGASIRKEDHPNQKDSDIYDKPSPPYST